MQSTMMAAMAKDETVQASVRIPRSWMARADALAASLSKPGFQATRADVLRMALAKGFDLLEAESQATLGSPKTS